MYDFFYQKGRNFDENLADGDNDLSLFVLFMSKNYS